MFLSNKTGRFGKYVRSTTPVEFDKSFADLQAATRRTLLQLTTARIPVVVMLDPPMPAFDVPTCQARSIRHAWYPGGGCAIDRSRSVIPKTYDVQRAAAADLPNVYFIDLTDRLCDVQTCPTVRDGHLVYRDDHHLTATFAESLTNELEGSLLADVAALREAR